MATSRRMAGNAGNGLNVLAGSRAGQQLLEIQFGQEHRRRAGRSAFCSTGESWPISPRGSLPSCIGGGFQEKASGSLAARPGHAAQAELLEEFLQRRLSNHKCRTSRRVPRRSKRRAARRPVNAMARRRSSLNLPVRWQRRRGRFQTAPRRCSCGDVVAQGIQQTGQQAGAQHVHVAAQGMAQRRPAPGAAGAQLGGRVGNQRLPLRFEQAQAGQDAGALRQSGHAPRQRHGRRWPRAAAWREFCPRRKAARFPRSNPLRA